jgi:hypothetical protein
MTQDDIIKMADASGISYYGMGKDSDRFLHHVETFTDLVASAEREACAKVCEAQGEYGDEQYAAAIRARSQA